MPFTLCYVYFISDVLCVDKNNHNVIPVKTHFWDCNKHFDLLNKAIQGIQVIGDARAEVRLAFTDIKLKFPAEFELLVKTGVVQLYRCLIDCCELRVGVFKFVDAKPERSSLLSPLSIRELLCLVIRGEGRGRGISFGSKISHDYASCYGILRI